MTSEQSTLADQLAIAVVVVSYNSAECLRQCVRAIEQQTVKPVECIVVDNASTEHATRELLTEYDALTWLTVMRLDTNRGYGAAINHAVAALSGIEFLVVLNPDAYAAPDCLDQLIDCANRHPNAASIAPLMLSAKAPDVIDGAGDEWLWHGYPRRRFHGKGLSAVTLNEEPVLSACAGACLYRLSALRSVGGFDEAYFMYLEDVDVGVRLQLLGYSCWFTPKAQVNHEGSATTGYRSEFSTFYGHRNVSRLMLKNASLRFLPVMLLGNVLAGIAMLFIAVRRGQARTYLRAKAAGQSQVWGALLARSKVNRRAALRFGLRITSDNK